MSDWTPRAERALSYLCGLLGLAPPALDEPAAVGPVRSAPPARPMATAPAVH